MITEEQKVELQKLYDDIGNIKKVAKISHVSYNTLKSFIVFKNTKKIKTLKPIDTSKYRKDIKRRLVEYKGEICQLCGYNRCIDALDFHHIKEKTYNISGGTKSFEKLKNEVDKCILVCSNCHREIHAGIVKL